MHARMRPHVNTCMHSRTVPPQFLELLKDATNASGAYLAIKDKPDSIRYINATESDQLMVGKRLTNGTGAYFLLIGVHAV